MLAAIRFLALTFSLCLSLALAPAAWAQDGLTDADYSNWDKLATQVEKTVADGSAADQTLSNDRDQIVKWRDRLQGATGANASRISSVKDQITALGPVPAEGQTEAADVAARRQELNTQLSELQAPGLKAVEAASRANAIIQSIDQQQRDRQARLLLHQSPSPLLPSSWAAAARELGALMVGLTAEPFRQYQEMTADDLRQRAPSVAAYLLGALFLLIFGRRWFESLPARLSQYTSDSSRDVAGFVASLGQIVIPTAGMILVVIAAEHIGMIGNWWWPIIASLPAAGVVFFSGLWLARRFLPLHGGGPINLSDQARIRARIYATALAGLGGLHQIFATVVTQLSGASPDTSADVYPLRFSEEAAGVLHLPLIVLGSFFLFKLGVVLRKASQFDGADLPPYRVRIVTGLGVLLRPLAVLIVGAAALGYVTLANGVLWPLVQTVALLALLILLQEFIADLYGMVLRDRSVAQDALLPVLIGFLLVIASLPVFALIWGARSSDLGEAWARLRQGIAIGGINISPGGILTFMLVFGLGYVITRAVQGAFRSSILPKTRIDAGGQNAIVSGLGYVGIILAVVLAVTSAGINLSSLAIVAGALSVGIGFGMQNIVSNFVSGIILLIERPIAIGDWINVKGSEGYVRRISVRSTQIQTFDRSDIIVPNSDLISNPVTNWTRGSPQGRIIIPISVGYDSDTRKVADILVRIAEDQPTVLIDPSPFVLFKDFGADGLNLELRCVLSDINGSVGVQTEIRHQIMEKFREAGIEIPFAQRDINIRAAGGLKELVQRALDAEQGKDRPKEPPINTAVTEPTAPPAHVPSAIEQAGVQDLNKQIRARSTEEVGHLGGDDGDGDKA